MIDAQGFRSNVGIILVNQRGRLFWARRIGQKHAWQFPQGGINENETSEEALYRELAEEIGLLPSDVEIIGNTKGWLKYRLPRRYIRHHSKPLCIGQKQKWYLLRLLSDETHLCLDNSDNPEFDKYRWVYYWHPLKEVVAFKRHVYRRALREFSPKIDALFPRVQSNKT